MKPRVLLVLMVMLTVLVGCDSTTNMVIDQFASRENNDYRWEISYELDGFHFAEEAVQQSADATYDPKETGEIQYPESHQARVKLHLAKVDDEGEEHQCFSDVWLYPIGEGLYPEKAFYVILDQNGNRISPEQDAAGVTALRFRVTRGR